MITSKQLATCFNKAFDAMGSFEKYSDDILQQIEPGFNVETRLEAQRILKMLFKEWLNR